MKSVQLIVFDLAGTTVDDNRDVHRVLQAALRDFDVDISMEDANEVMGIPKPVAIEKLLLKRHFGKKVISESWIEEIHHLFVRKMTRFYEEDPSVKEKGGATETFQQLKAKGICVAVDTGFDRSIADVLLNRLNWLKEGLIDYSVTSDEVPQGRPHPDMIYKIMAHFSIEDPAHVAKVGDTPSDLLEGGAAGCGWVIGITTGAFSRNELSLIRHTHLVDTLPEILPLLEPLSISKS